MAPTSPAGRVKAIARLARGFIYVVSVLGITGERRALPPELDAQVRTLRLVTTKPVCVGFGVSTPAQVAAVGQLADGVIVGSAIVRLIERHTGDPSLIDEVVKFIPAAAEYAPKTAFFTSRGRAMYIADAGRFARSRLCVVRASWCALADEFCGKLAAR